MFSLPCGAVVVTVVEAVAVVVAGDVLTAVLCRCYGYALGLGCRCAAVDAVSVLSFVRVCDCVASVIPVVAVLLLQMLWSPSRSLLLWLLR